MVMSIWALQIGALIFALIQNADLGGALDRLKNVFKSPVVWALTLGCFGFMYAASSAAGSMDYAGVTLGTISFLIEFSMLVGVILRALFRRGGGYEARDFTFGSAEFATPDHIRAQGLTGATGIRLGFLRHALAEMRLPLHYTGQRHILTCAPTRSGKGVSSIIPNALTYEGSMIVVDVKGENARISHARRDTIGSAFALDPWGISGQPVARFNPLDILTPDSPTLIEDATLIGEALIAQENGDSGKHFSEQSVDLVKCILIYLTIMRGEVKTLGRLRDILTAPIAEWTKLLAAMAKTGHPVVVAGAAQIVGKNDKEWLSILSTAQRNTHFLDSPALRKNLEASDFSFADLKGDKPVSIFLVLPVDRLSSHNRWLRMIIALSIAVLARTPEKPKTPVLFVLDEMAHLGRLAIIEEAYGLMAGLGLMMHAIVQDLSQLQRVYGEGWQTFVGNAGVIQVFGTRDLMTAEYFSKLVGVTTTTVRSTSTSSGSTSGSGPNGGSTNAGSSTSWAPTQRPLLFPDELMRMDAGAQILFVENANPIVSDKIVWHADPAYKALAGGKVYALS